MLDKLIQKTGSKGLLVLKTDCLGLTASIVNGLKDELKITHTAHTRDTDPVAALTDVLTQLKASLGKNLPTETILLHINAIPSRVEITQSGEIAGEANLAEMMRWEMDGVVADQSPMWDLGWVLLQRGYLNTSQYRQLLEFVLEEKRLSAKHGGSSAMRVGEIAVREHFATQDQIAECLQVQEKLQIPDQRLLTQWRPIPSSELDSEFGLGSETEQHAYLCSAMPIAQHLQWVNTFNKVGQMKGLPKLSLKSVYPCAGLTLPLVDAHEDHILLTEFHPAYAFCALVENGILRDTVMFKSSNQPLDIDTIAETLQNNNFTDASRWIVANIDGVDISFIDELEQRLDFRAEFLPKAAHSRLTTPKDSKHSLLAELGAAAHFQGKAPLMVSPLAGMPPPAPLYQRKSFKLAVAAAIVPVIIVSYEAYRQLQIGQLEASLIEKETRLSQFGDDRGDIQADIKRAEKNIQQYKALENSLYSLEYKKDLVQSVMLKRQDVIEKLLPTLAHSINDGVILDSLNETDWYQFTITGRAVDQSSIDEFNRVLSINLQPLELQIINSPSRLESQEEFNYGGVYVFEFTIRQRLAS